MKTITNKWMLSYLAAVSPGMGAAIGAAAALSVQRTIPSRDIPASDIVALTLEHGAVAV